MKKLCRMSVEECAPSQLQMARSVHEQSNYAIGPVDVEAIAYALDIVAIEYRQLKGFEGALLTDANKSEGGILVNSDVNSARQRFTLAHELGHFLHPTHVPNSDEGFLCSSNEIHSNQNSQKQAPSCYNANSNKLDDPRSDSQIQNERQELEANRFAIELLAPQLVVQSHLKQEICLEHIVELAQQFEISKEAMARRYISLCPEPAAIIFHKNGKMLRHAWCHSFPHFCFTRGEKLPHLATKAKDAAPSPFETLDPEDWIYKPNDWLLAAQTLHQQNNYGMTLITAQEIEDDLAEEDQDTYERFNRF